MAYTPAAARSFIQSRMPPTWRLDDNDHRHYLAQRWPWLCSYCHTVQKSDRDSCVNCSAPRPEPTPEARP